MPQRASAASSLTRASAQRAPWGSLARPERCLGLEVIIRTRRPESSGPGGRWSRPPTIWSSGSTRGMTRTRCQSAGKPYAPWLRWIFPSCRVVLHSIDATASPFTAVAHGAHEVAHSAHALVFAAQLGDFVREVKVPGLDGNACVGRQCAVQAGAASRARSSSTNFLSCCSAGDGGSFSSRVCSRVISPTVGATLILRHCGGVGCRIGSGPVPCSAIHFGSCMEMLLVVGQDCL